MAKRRGSRPAQKPQRHPAADILARPLGHLAAADNAGTRDARARAYNEQYGTTHDPLGRGQGFEIPVPFTAPGPAHEDRRVRELQHVAEQGRLPASDATGIEDAMGRHRPRAADPWARRQPIQFPDPPAAPGGVTRHG